jgi:hypothetical protein
MVAGLQILVGYFSVAAHGPRPPSTEPVVLTGRRRGQSPAPHATDITFSVRPPAIKNEIWVVFRGTRDRRSGHLAGEIVPDLHMRSLGLLVTATFLGGGVVTLIAAVLMPVLGGRPPSFFAFAWATLALALSTVWTRACGAAVHKAASNVHRDSPGVRVVWRLGLRAGVRSPGPNPPPTGADAATT